MRAQANRGIAIAMATDVMLPSAGKHFMLNIGGSHYGGESAVGITGSGRLTENVALYFGAAADTTLKEAGGKAGISFQW